MCRLCGGYFKRRARRQQEWESSTAEVKRVSDCFGAIWSSKRRQRNKCKWILHIILWFGTGNSNSNANRPPPDWSHTHTQSAQKSTISLPKGFIHVFSFELFIAVVAWNLFFFSSSRGRRRWRQKKENLCEIYPVDVKIRALCWIYLPWERNV